MLSVVLLLMFVSFSVTLLCMVMKLLFPPVPVYVAPVVVCGILFFLIAGIIVGILLVLLCRIFISGLHESKVVIFLIIIIVCANFKSTGKCGTLLLVIILIFVFGLGIGVLIGYCCVRNKKGSIKQICSIQS